MLLTKGGVICQQKRNDPKSRSTQSCFAERREGRLTGRWNKPPSPVPTQYRRNEFCNDVRRRQVVNLMEESKAGASDTRIPKAPNIHIICSGTR